MDIVTREFIVGTKSGLHARPASQIARTVHGFDATVTLWKGHQRADAKSVFSILILEAGPGSTIRVEVSGPERHQVLTALSTLFENNFQEVIG
ncbi:MAG: HPr family phosphocarrier protein [Myxococcales bacterium]|nr:HPr family phosphocarrier protein [Myxococcales bacterium]